MTNPLVDKLREVILPPVAGAGYDLVDVEWKHEQVGWVCRVLIDRTDVSGGVSHADCERVSREVSAVLDVHDVIPHAYALEVSSPGLNRPLRTIEHFQRFVGDKAKITMREAQDGRRNYAGRIVRVDEADGRVVLDVDGREYALRVAGIEKAHREHEFEKKRKA